MTYLACAVLFVFGFLVGRLAAHLSKPQCPELKEVTAYVGWDDDEDRRMYKRVVSRCELKDLHYGPCLISKCVDNPVYWNPEDELPLPVADASRISR